MNMRASNITNTSFVVHWDEVDDANRYIIKWRGSDGIVGENTTSQASCTVRGLTPNTKYNVTVAARNSCGCGTGSNISFVTTSGMTTSVIPLLSSIASTTSSINVNNPSIIITPTGMC